MNTLEGKLLAEGQRVGIVAARFNEFITSKLLGGAIDAFVRHGGDENPRRGREPGGCRLGAGGVRDSAGSKEDGKERQV